MDINKLTYELIKDLVPDDYTFKKRSSTHENKQNRVEKRKLETPNLAGAAKVTLNEIGESTATPYPYKLDHDDLALEGNELFGTVAYSFVAGDGSYYDVVFEYDYDVELGKNVVKVDFTSDGSYEMTNTNEPYKIMSTVFSILKKELSRNTVKDNLEVILYMPAETKTNRREDSRLKGIQQRNKLYKAFFEKNIPYLRVEETPNETRFYLKEEIAASEAYRNDTGLETIIKGKRNVGFFTAVGGVGITYEDVLKKVKRYNLEILPVEGNDYGAYIVYRPEGKQDALELKKIAEKHGGYLSSKAPAEETRRIGELLGYRKEDIDEFIEEKYGENMEEGLYTSGEPADSPVESDKTSTVQKQLEPYIQELTKYMYNQGMNIDPAPEIEFVEDEDNAKNILGRTAYYDPNNKTVVLYITGRHPKDILRSFSHEMIHHIQNLEGRLKNMSGTTNINEDEYLADIEREAYDNGNMIFRSWENDRAGNNSIKNMRGFTPGSYDMQPSDTN